MKLLAVFFLAACAYQASNIAFTHPIEAKSKTVLKSQTELISKIKLNGKDANARNKEFLALIKQRCKCNVASIVFPANATGRIYTYNLTIPVSPIKMINRDSLLTDSKDLKLAFVKNVLKDSTKKFEDMQIDYINISDSTNYGLLPFEYSIKNKGV